jgi:lipopolysaccharide export system permease protein
MGLSRVTEWLKAHSPVSRLDRYLIGKFLGTYFFSIILIISIAVVFDINENIDKFLTRNATMKEIFFDYYLNFIPYYSNLFSQLFVFISVIFFTTKLAENSEIIAMMSTGVSFPRLVRPYLISAAIIAVLSFLLGSYVIPRGNVKRVKFENTYKRRNVPTYTANVQLEVDTGVIAYISRYENQFKTGYDFTLDKFVNKQLVSRLQAMSIQYDSLSAEPYHWIINNYQIRDLQGRREVITKGTRIDSIIQMEPQDFLITKGQQETLTSPELRQYISKQIDRGSGNVVQYEVEYHKRIATSFASFILTIIGASLSSRKRKGGMGLYLGIGLALSFTYILLQTISSTFAINADTPPMLAAWIPNILYAIIAYFCYRQAPN